MGDAQSTIAATVYINYDWVHHRLARNIYLSYETESTMIKFIAPRVLRPNPGDVTDVSSTVVVDKSRASRERPKTVGRWIPKDQRADLRDHYFYQLSEYTSANIVFIDELSFGQGTGSRRMAWSPHGTTPVRIPYDDQECPYHVMLAYSQDGVLLSRIFQGSMGRGIFEDFLEQLLHHCGRWPESNSVLIMDNAPFHHTERVKDLCAEAGVVLLYLPPYSSDLNPISKFSTYLKWFVWKNREGQAGDDFGHFLEWCVDKVGARAHVAKNHFRDAGVDIDELQAKTYSYLYSD